MNEATEIVSRAHKEIKLSAKDIERFWSKVDKDGPMPDQTKPHYTGLGPCWLWAAGIRSDGCGQFKIGDKNTSAHRVAWVIAYGGIPHDGSYHGICVCHKCDNQVCCNPSHMFLGTNKDNIKDREFKGRGSKARGEAKGKAKLNTTKVLEIRAKHAAGGVYQNVLAVQFGVSRALINRVIHRKTWVHV